MDFTRGQVLSVDFHQSDNFSTSIDYDINGSIISIAPFTLNKKDNFTVKAICAGHYVRDIKVQAKITGGKIMNKIVKKSAFLTYLPYYIGLITGMVTSPMLSNIQLFPTSEAQWGKILSALIVYLSLFFVGFYVSDKFSQNDK